MYKIIGADGKEYGPISAEQLQGWIREGRANGQTKVQPESSTDWKTLAEIPEFAAALSSTGPHSSTPPLAVTIDPEALAAQILARGYTIDIGNCISRGWELVKKDLTLLVGATFLVFLVMAGVGMIPILGAIAGLLIDGALLGGLYLVFLKRIRGEAATIGEAFAGFSLAFVQLMLAQLVVGLLGGLGFICCILPGVYLMVAWIFTLPLVIDKKLDFWPAMELSRKVVHQHWWEMFGLLIVCGLVNLIGVLALCIGVFVTIPVGLAALMYAYEDILEPNLPPRILEQQASDGRARRTAWGYVLSNLVLPGLGTFAAGRRLEGALQLVVSQGGFVLMMTWTISFVRLWKQQGGLPDDFGPHAGLCALGMAMFFLGWIWSLASSYGILQNSRTRGL